MYNSLRTCSAFEGAEVSTREAKKIGKKKKEKKDEKKKKPTLDRFIIVDRLLAEI